jgi:hypothetical protein
MSMLVLVPNLDLVWGGTLKLTWQLRQGTCYVMLLGLQSQWLAGGSGAHLNELELV